MDKPSIDIAEKYTYADEVTISCKAEGNPVPKISWSRDGKSLAGGGSTLTFNRIQYSDVGYYTCTAKNTANELTSSADIIVDGECVVTIIDEQVTFHEPNTADLLLVCKVEGPECESKLIFIYSMDNSINDWIVI